MAKKKITEEEIPKALPSVMLPISKLHFDTKNVQKQDKKTFAALKENMRIEGFDEPILVIPHPDFEGEYHIVAGNHRVKAAKELGMSEVPAVIRTDWNMTTAHLQGVRRNYGRGQLDKTAFTLLVDDIKNAQEMSLADIQDSMGITEIDDFADLYQSVAAEEEAKVEKERAARTENANKEKVKVLEDMELILSHIYEEYGDTIPNGFLVFPAGGNKHMFISATNALKNVITKVATQCLVKHTDISVALAGLITIGLHASKFLDEKESVEEAADEHTVDPDDTSFEKIT